MKNYKKIILIAGMLLLIIVMCTVLILFSKRNTKVKNIAKEVTVQHKTDNESDTVELGDVEIEYIDKTILETIENEEAGTVFDKERLLMEETERYFTEKSIDEAVLKRIRGKSYPENARISLNELRYIKVLHYNYNHEIQVGELIVNKAISRDCVQIFHELFRAEYEIASMKLVDDFWTGDSVDSDTNSIAHNNTSAFNYRTVPGKATLSNHARGLAIDINPIQNPYVTYNSDDSFAKYYKDMELYIDRNSGKEHMITHQDICYQIFTQYGFSWGGNWNSVKDYQHFEK